MRPASVLAALLMFAVMPALGDDQAPPPHPRPNPSADVEPDTVVKSDANPSPEAKPDAAVTPEPNPSGGADDSEAVVRPEPNPLDEEDSDKTKEAAEPEPSPFGEEVPPEPADEKALTECEAELRKLGGIFERLPMIDGKGTCGMAAPYRLDKVGQGVRLEPASEMTCETALAFAKWVNRVVVPATRALGDDIRLTKIRQGSTYICRQRNSLKTEKISYHAYGLAIDILSFQFDGHAPIAVSPRAGNGNLEEAFQRAVRGGACLYFTTVLGPGDAFHGNHLHLDIAKRNRGYRLCQ